MSCTTFSVANLKGGCGKSTLALNLAAGLMLRGKTVLLDADPQGTLAHWANHEGFSGVSDVVAAGASASLLVREIRSASADYRYVVVDCPPTLECGRTEAALKMADIVLIPVLPSPTDLWSSAHMVEAVQSARRTNPGLRAYFVRNQVEPKSALSQAMREALRSCGLPSLESTVGRRAAYRWAALEGVSVYQLGARGKKAVRDIESVIEEVLDSDQARG